MNRKVALGVLTKRGHDVLAVDDGRQAIEAIEREQFDVILMDVQMPGTNGLDATRAIREKERAGGLPHTPIIALTAHAMTGDRERCLRAGMDDYVAKPVDAEDLFQAIERVGKTISRADPPIPPLAPDPIILDREAMLRRVGADTELLFEMVKNFNEESAGLLIEVRRSIVERDAGRLERVAHSLKGALRTLAASAASEAALELETMARQGDLSRADKGWERLESEMTALKRALTAVTLTSGDGPTRA